MRHLERCLQVQEVLDPEDRVKRCDLLLALEEALLPAGEPQRAVGGVAPEALALAEALGDAERAGRAAVTAATALRRYGDENAVFTPEFREWAARADHYAAPGSVARVYADLALASIEYLSGTWPEFTSLTTRALATARDLGDREALFAVASRLIDTQGPASRQGERLRLAEEFTTRPREGVSAFTLGTLLFRSGSTFLSCGQRERAEALWREVAALAGRTRDPTIALYPLRAQGILALLDGRLEEAVAFSQELIARGDELGAPSRARLFAIGEVSQAFLLLGRAEEALALVRDAARLRGADPATPPPGSARLFAHVGSREDARKLLHQDLKLRNERGGEQATAYQGLVVLLETAILLEEREAAGLLRSWLEAGADLVAEPRPFTCVARHLGAAAALLGEPESARAYCEQALAVAERIRYRPEIALIRLQMAELLLGSPNPPAPFPGKEGGDRRGGRASVSLSLAGEGRREGELQAPEDARAVALTHLEFAIAEFRQMKMHPALERALALHERLHQAAAPVPGIDRRPAHLEPAFSAERRLVTVLFTDISGSTERAAALGDRAWRHLKAQHHALVRRELERYRGHEVDTAGDGFFATFDGPARAIRCACAIRDTVRELGLEIHAGLHLGEVEEQDGGVSGMTVHIGARVAALAGPSEVLVSQTLKELVGGSGITFAERGSHTLKGVPGAWQLYAVAEPGSWRALPRLG